VDGRGLARLPSGGRRMTADREATVRCVVRDRIATITLNRPRALNAVTFDMEALLDETLREADADPGVGCIVLTGEGRGFCAGDDVKDQWGDPRMAEALVAVGSPRATITPFVATFLEMLTPTVAAVNGPAIGLGMDLALMCDIRIAADSARFSQGYVRMGLLPDVAGLWVLPRLVGPSNAAELLLTGEVIDGAEAARIGLVSRVVPDEQLHREAAAVAARIAAMPPLAVAATKEAIRRAIGRTAGDLDDVAAIRGSRLAQLFETRDHAEAVAAFTEKRAPRFEGR
jgi:enoyl-CoA hydratase/carnithine racemase